MNIDVDSHYTPPELYDNIPARYEDAPKLVDNKLFTSQGVRMNFSLSYDLRTRKHAMREAGFDMQCLNLGLESIPKWWMKPETELLLTQRWNDLVAKVCQENPCFIGIAQVPQRDPAAAALEAERAVRDLGFKAIGTEGQWAGKNFASEEWSEFFGTVSKLDVPLVSHPAGRSAKTKFNYWMPGAEQLQKLLTTNGGLLGFLVQHMISMLSLIELGVLDKYPNLRVAWMETDVGWVPAFMEMVDEFYNTHKISAISPRYEPLEESQLRTINLRKKPSQYFKDNYYYAINFATPIQMNYLVPLVIEKLGMGKNILIETDYDHTEGNLDIVRTVMRTEAIPAEYKERICGRNAAELLKIKWAPSEFEELFA